MRAVTGAITAARPSSIAKARRILLRFEHELTSGILSSDAATYLRTAIEAATELDLFRRDLRVRQQPVGGDEGGERRRPAPVDEGDRWEPKVEEEEVYGVEVPAADEERKEPREDEEPWEEKEGAAAPHGDLHGPASEKRRKKKEKRVKEEYGTGDTTEKQTKEAIGDALQGMVSREGVDSGKKGEKKKKKHLKQEDLVAEQPEQKMVHVGVNGVSENGSASEEKKRKKRKHTEEELVKKEAVDDGDFGSDKKRKKKRGRGGDDGNDTELLEHKHKKQRQ